jgi:hypothetical protein
MSINRTDDAVAEYLRELELRLSGLPLLQRRELLADLEAHITTERIERSIVSEGEVLEILERLGSPEVVAAAAYEEAGLRQPAAAGSPGPDAGYRLPPVPPPPDPPRFTGPPPHFAGAPFSGRAHPQRPTGGRAGLRIAVALAIATAVVAVLGCLAGAFMLTRSATVEGDYSEVPQPAAPMATAPTTSPAAPTAPTAPTRPGE